MFLKKHRGILITVINSEITGANICFYPACRISRIQETVFSENTHSFIFICYTDISDIFMIFAKNIFCKVKGCIVIIMINAVDGRVILSASFGLLSCR